MEHKPPAIFAVHWLAAAISGGSAWGIRLLEIAVTLSLGPALAVSLLAPRGRGWSGIAALLSAGFYYTHFDYWRTAQTEIWIAAAVAWACCLLRKPRSLHAAAAGALLAFACCLKFIAAVFALPLGLLLLRSQEARGPRLLAFAAGGLGVVALCFLPFVVSGRGEALWQALVEFNRYYREAVKFREMGYARFWLQAAPFYTASACLGVAAASWLAWRERSRKQTCRVALLLLFGAAGVAGVQLQDKFLAYHWGLLVPFVAGCILLGLEAGERLLPAPRRAPERFGLRFRSAAPLAVAIAIVAGALASESPPSYQKPSWRPRPYRERVLLIFDHLTGSLDRRAYLNGYDFLYPVGDVAALAGEAEALARSGDSFCVVSLFAPSAYAWTRLRCPSRFFSDHTLGYLSLRPELARPFADWPAEHLRALRGHPPRFVLTTRADADFAASLTGRRYRPVAAAGSLLLLERAEDQRSAPPPPHRADRPGCP